MSLKTLKRHEGWLLIDHSASPGIPADIAVKLGMDPKTVAAGAVFESATITCNHCGNAYRKNPLRLRPRGYCKVCDHYLCDRCEGLKGKPNYIHRTKYELANAAAMGVALTDSVSIIVP